MLYRLAKLCPKRGGAFVPGIRGVVVCTVATASLLAGSAMAQTVGSRYAFKNTLLPEPAHLQVGEGHLLIQPGMTAGVGEVGVTMASTVSKAFRKSRRIKVRTFWARRQYAS